MRTLGTIMRRNLVLSCLCAGLILTLAGCSDDESVGPDPIVVGGTWRVVESGIPNSIQALAANDTLVIAVGDGGIIYSSTDGTDWVRERPYGPNDGLTDIIWFNDRFVAVGLNGMNITSPDGITWSTGNFLESNLYALAATDELVAAVGNEGRIYTSDDGVEWDLVNETAGLDLNDIIYTPHGGWLAAGEETVLRSTNTETWLSQSTGFPAEEDIVALAANDTSAFLIAADGVSQDFSFYNSTNADNWYHRSTIPAWNLKDLAWTGSEFVAVGEGTNFQVGMADGLVFTSPDGLSWSEIQTEAPFALATIEIVDGGLMVAGVGGYVLSGPSPNELAITTSGADMTGVVWDGSRFVAVTSQGTVMFSSDGSNWSERHSGVSNGFERLAWSGSKYVTAGGLGVPTDLYASPDGEQWTKTQAYDDAYINDVIWANGRFLACGQYGTIYMSETGDSWTKEYVGEDVNLNCIIFDGTRYLAAASVQVYESTDGADWESLEIDTTGYTVNLRRMIWTGYYYLAVGNDYSNPAQPLGLFCGSTDGTRWSSSYLGPAEKLNDVAQSSSHYFICGRDGNLWISTNAGDWTNGSPLGVEYDLNDFAVTSTRALVVGENRTVMVSP